MITNLTLRFGRSAGAPPATIAPGHMTVFVGPNNSGKTLALREIDSSLSDIRWSHQHAGFIPPDQRKNVAQVDTPKPTASEIERLLTTGSGSIWNFFSGQQMQMPGPPADVLRMITQENRADLRDAVAAIYTRTKICMLDGIGRLNLATVRQAASLNGPPNSHLQALFVDDVRRNRIKQAVKDAFGFYVLIDPTTPGQFKFCLAEELPSHPDIERSLTKEALDYFSKTIPMEMASDGVKAYSGIIAAVLSADFRLLLIDEPEAFLHPPLARKLGLFLTRITGERAATVFASTHSSDFVVGCVQAGTPVDVVRLTYERNVATARVLPGNRLTELMRDPLLRSAGVLSSLFYRGAVVCEADTDRAFYGEINDRLLRFSKGGADDTLFLNAQNWQTCSNIIRPLREMGIPAAAAVDLDVLLSDDLSKLLTAAFVPPITAAGWTQTRARIKAAFEKQLKPGEGPKELARLVKIHGVEGLVGGDRDAVEQFVNDLSSYGLFLVPAGEVERWLPELQIQGHGSRWLVPVFERMGGDPQDPRYIHPGDGDVWGFVARIAAWIADPHRKGVPA